MVLDDNKKGKHMTHISSRATALFPMAFLASACTGVEAEPSPAERAITSHSSALNAGIVRPAIAENASLVALWHMDECSEDSVYLGPGGINGVGCANGRIAAAAVFDGIDDRIEFPDQAGFNFTSEMSISVWTKPSRITGLGTLVSKWYAPDSYMLAVDNEQWSFSLAFPGGVWGQSYSIKAPAIAEAWTHLVASFDGWTMRLFVNGVLANSFSVQPPSLPARRLQESTRPITIGNHPAWNAYAGFIDEVSLYNTALSEAEAWSLAHPKTRIERKVAVVAYNPVNPTEPSQTLRDYYGWPNPFQLSEQIDDKLREITGGFVDYRIVATLESSSFPQKLDGYRDTWSSYLACRSNTNLCHQPDAAAYLPVLTQDFGQNFCEAIERNEIDEIWLWGAGYFGFDEFAYKVPGDAIPHQPEPYSWWIYDGRVKDLPECGRPYFVMGWVPERVESVGLHSYGHRIESAMTISEHARGLWHRCGSHGSSEWTDYICIDQDDPGNAGCGDVHYPPNGQNDYDYSNTRSVMSRCDDYFDYPNLADAKVPVSADTWGGSEVGYLSWWMRHLPSDWWHSILCIGERCPEVSAERTRAKEELVHWAVDGATLAADPLAPR